jgi:hypothetical protein
MKGTCRVFVDDEPETIRPVLIAGLRFRRFPEFAF